jgi:hypothetical protein
MTRTAVSIVALVLMLAAACSGSPDASPPTSRSPTPALSPVIAAITYKVTGGAPKVRVHYGVTGQTKVVTTTLPWQATGQAPVGANVEMSAFGLGKQGYRIACTLTLSTPGRSPYQTFDSSHAIGTGGTLANPTILYDDQCNTAATVPAAPTP